jgi:ankyrin repeat protein
MRKLALLLFILFLSGIVSAGVYQDMEEALISGDTPSAIKLVNRGVDVNTVDIAGNTLLMQSVRRDNKELFEFLLQRRARMNVRNRNGETALSLAAFLGNIAFAQRLVDAGAEVNSYGWSPLAYAAFNGHVEIVELLLKRGAEINGLTENSSSALVLAARNGHLQVVDVLLKHKADPNLATQNGETAIDWAQKTNNSEIVEHLRQAGGRSHDALVVEISK